MDCLKSTVLEDIFRIHMRSEAISKNRLGFLLWLAGEIDYNSVGNSCNQRILTEISLFSVQLKKQQRSWPW